MFPTTVLGETVKMPLNQKPAYPVRSKTI